MSKIFKSASIPELALAIVFNGTFIYFYTAHKMGFEINRLMTGGFYAFLAFSYLLAGVFFVAKRPQRLKLGTIDLLFFLFFSLVFLSYFLSSMYTGSESAYTKIAYAPLLVIAPYLGVMFLSSEKKIINFLRYSVYVAAILIIPAFYELMFNSAFFESTRFSMMNLEEHQGNPIQFGITFATLLIILFVLCLEQKKIKFKHIVLIVPSMFLLLRSGSRGAVFSLFIALLFYVFVSGRLSFKVKSYALIVIVTFCIGAYKFIPQNTLEFYQYTFTPEAQSEEASSVYQRITRWEGAFNDFKENPILGVGLGNSVNGGGDPHNILLEVAAEMGIIGVLIFSSMIYLTIQKARVFIIRNKKPSLNIAMQISLILFLYSLTEAMFSGYITNQTMLFMSMGLIAALMKLRLKRIGDSADANEKPS
jgi:Lipid A core - O-antigen ligase and related enzymes